MKRKRNFTVLLALLFALPTFCLARYVGSRDGLLHEDSGAIVIADEQAGAFVNSFGFRVNPDHSLIVSGGTGGGGSGTVTSVTLTGDGTVLSSTPSSAVTTSGTLTAAMANAGAGTILANATGSSATPTYTSAPVLGLDNTTAGTLQLANGSAAAHTIFASGATTTNTIKGFATVPTTGHLVTCTTSSTTCTLTDGGAVPAGTITSVGLAGTANQITVTGSSPITSSGSWTLSLTPVLTTTGTSVSLTAPSQIYVCTSTCTVTPPVPAAGYQFCVFNGDNVSTVITLAALSSSAKYENTARTAYGTAGTGTFVSGGAVGDAVCIVGLDSTHYITINTNGAWTAN